MTTKKYSSIYGLTGQFRFCGNCFRLDSYRGCTFGCRYCYVSAKENTNPIKGKLHNTQPQIGDSKKLARLLNNPPDSIEGDLIKAKTPFHFGGMSDPFQYQEIQEGNTLKFLRILEKHMYPCMISTKAGIYQITDEHLKSCDPKLVCFQISLISMNQKHISLMERHSPTVTDRIALIHKLKDMGYWVSVRIQPLIWIDDAIELVKTLSETVDYITVEHLKLMATNKKLSYAIANAAKIPLRHFYHHGRKWEMIPQIKYENIKKLKRHCKCPVGVGDNDLHYLSDTANCCGIDTVGPNFANWLSHNCMTIEKGVCGKPLTSKSIQNKLPMHFLRKDLSIEQYVRHYLGTYLRALYKPKTNRKPLL